MEKPYNNYPCFLGLVFHYYFPEENKLSPDQGSLVQTCKGKVSLSSLPSAIRFLFSLTLSSLYQHTHTHTQTNQPLFFLRGWFSDWKMSSSLVIKLGRKRRWVHWGYELKRVGMLRNGGSEESIWDLFDINKMHESSNEIGLMKKKKVSVVSSFSMSLPNTRKWVRIS